MISSLRGLLLHPNTGKLAVSRFQLQRVSRIPDFTHRYSSSVRFLDDKRSGEENIYFQKEDQILLQNLLANHPELDPKYSSGQLAEFGDFGRDVQIVCQKHGITIASLAFLNDIVSVFESHGWMRNSGSSKSS
ncbi:hypothetical protein IE077_000318 [Cardiosporidium cionae]|uniref:Uncharacterized protein n=1 Tax=Cardiosporidium cionae TaxID=476202 RepID=A0ABQ7JGR0_9APIC|nr:hypothetical protein IE077_000318 [Cardiosporidium cionae]|eukprot:KAF8822880.1 hypothetical protein IE077_000318 [Cardiosporidium cionae]